MNLAQTLGKLREKLGRWVVYRERIYGSKFAVVEGTSVAGTGSRSTRAERGPLQVVGRVNRHQWRQRERRLSRALQTVEGLGKLAPRRWPHHVELEQAPQRGQG